MNKTAPHPKAPSELTGDLVLREMWRIKDKLSASYGHDVSRLFEEARRHQAKRTRPVSRRGKKPGTA